MFCLPHAVLLSICITRYEMTQFIRYDRLVHRSFDMEQGLDVLCFSMLVGSSSTWSMRSNHLELRWAMFTLLARPDVARGTPVLSDGFAIDWTRREQ